jgi:hypothetical protein
MGCKLEQRPHLVRRGGGVHAVHQQERRAGAGDVRAQAPGAAVRRARFGVERRRQRQVVAHEQATVTKLAGRQRERRRGAACARPADGSVRARV